MSNKIKINKNNQNNINKDNFTQIIFNSLNEIEQRTKNVNSKNMQIKENIRSIKLKDKKLDKLNEEVVSKKEELKLIKELLLLKEEKNMNINDIIDSYLGFLITSNNILDNKIDSLFQREINNNSKQKIINKLLGNRSNEDDYDYIYEIIKKPIDINKFRVKQKGKNNPNEIMDLDRYDMNMNDLANKDFNMNNIHPIKTNNIYSGLSHEKIPPYNFPLEEEQKINSINNNVLDEYETPNIKSNSIYNNNERNSNLYNKGNNNKNIPKYKNDKDYFDNIIDTDSYQKKKYNKDKLNSYPDKNYNNEKNKTFKEEYKVNDIDLNDKKKFAKTDINDFQNYNLKANNKLKRAREIFKRLLGRLKKSNELLFSKRFKNGNRNLSDFIYDVLSTHYFLRKILSILFECCLIYDPNNKIKNTETMHDSEFLGKLINSYEESDDIEEIANIQAFEKGLEEIKQITRETKQLKDKISSFASKINLNDVNWIKYIFLFNLF